MRRHILSSRRGGSLVVECNGCVPFARYASIRCEYAIGGRGRRLGSPYQSLCCSAHSRGEEQVGDHEVPQTVHRSRGLPRFALVGSAEDIADRDHKPRRGSGHRVGLEALDESPWKKPRSTANTGTAIGTGLQPLPAQAVLRLNSIERTP